MRIKVIYKKHEFHIDDENSETTIRYQSKLVIELIQSIISAVDGRDLVSGGDKT